MTNPLESGGNASETTPEVAAKPMPCFPPEVRCRICGFAVDLSKGAVAPEVWFTTAGRAKHSDEADHLRAALIFAASWIESGRPLEGLAERMREAAKAKT